MSILSAGRRRHSGATTTTTTASGTTTTTTTASGTTTTTTSENIHSGFGGSVFDIEGYRVHAFYSSGDFEISTDRTIEYLIVDGGGSGGEGQSGGGGGGGGGGVRSGSIFLSAGLYPVVVGEGGPTSSASPYQFSGQPSSFAGINGVGGGGGGGRGTNGLDGGSGGGGNPFTANGLGTPTLGYDGAVGGVSGISPDRIFMGGSGGGAQSVGKNGNISSQAGDGGEPFESSITGRPIKYGGGGGGGCGRNESQPYIYAGAGGNSGGSGSRGGVRQGFPGAPYRGGGGGGGGLSPISISSAGGAGGKGVVIIRYPYSGGNLPYIEPPQPDGWESQDAYLRVSNGRDLIYYDHPDRTNVFTPNGCVTADGSLLLSYRTGADHAGPGRTEIIRGWHRPYLWETPEWEAKPSIIIEPPGDFEDVRDAKLLTLANGNIILAYNVQKTHPDPLVSYRFSRPRVRISTDNGATFGPEIDPALAIPEWTDSLVPQGPVQRPSDGSILMSLYGSGMPAGWVGGSPILRSVDGGETWEYFSGIGASRTEPELVAGQGPGEWLCFAKIEILRSTDDGLTWSVLPSNFSSSNWVKPIRSTATGNLIGCLRSATAGIPTTGVFLSSDDGATWSTPLAVLSSDSTSQMGAYIYERAPGVFILVVGVGWPIGIRCTLLEEL
jgi:hypothetical protein